MGEPVQETSTLISGEQIEQDMLASYRACLPAMTIAGGEVPPENGA